jgi:uncharacterized protein (DUF2141 family)
MARFAYLIFAILLLASCAQVGSITGGAEDEIAPQIQKTTLVSGTTNFSGNSVEITFDEFILLNKPTETVFLVPADAKVEAKLAKKTLNLNWKESLLPNTTYTLYLNGVVKDVTEGNDSLMQITFSTGPIIDTLQLNAFVKDAFSNKPEAKVVVGLFDSLQAEKPRYFAKTFADGSVKLQSLKAGNYFIKAFNDKNNDLIIQKDEAQDWNFEPISIDTAFRDTLKLRISAPLKVNKIGNAQVLAPGLISVHVPEDSTLSRIIYNDKEFALSDFVSAGKDSLLFAIGKTELNPLQLILNQDTLSIRYLEKDRKTKLKPKYVEVENGFTDYIQLEVNDFIQEIDWSKVKLLSAKDSSEVKFEGKKNIQSFELKPPSFDQRAFILQMEENAVIGKSGLGNLKTNLAINLRLERELGSLNVKLSAGVENGILQLIQKEKVIAEAFLNANTLAVPFPNLIPGEYTFRILIDSNQNGSWDPINVNKKQLAEELIYFSTPVKVRANWEVETELVNDK